MFPLGKSVCKPCHYLRAEREGNKLFSEEHDRTRTVLNLDVLALSDVSAVPAPAWVAHGTPLNPAACVRKREAKKSSTFSRRKQPS